MSDSKNFAWPETSINLEDWEAFNEWYDQNREMIEQYRIIIWGAGIRGAEFRFFFQKRNYDNILFTDSDQKKWGGNINGILIISLDEARHMIETNVAKILVSVENSEEIENELLKWNLEFSVDFFTAKTDLYEKYVKEFKRSYECKNLFMGDCLFSTISMNDKLSSDLKKILKEKIGYSQSKVLAMHGISMSSMYYIFKAQLDEKMIPQNLILEINPEMMTGKQHLLPRSQHIVLLKRIYEELTDPDKSFEEYLETVEMRSKKYQIEFFLTSSSEVRRGANAINYFKLNYMYKLHIESEAVKLLEKLVSVGKQNDVNIIGFIPPVNYMYAEKLIGQDFFVKYEALREELKKIANNMEITLLDYSYEFDSQEFSEPDSSSETLNENGRLKLADYMIAALKENENGS